MISITDAQTRKILSLPFLSSTAYHNLDIEKTFIYMTKRYISSLKNHLNIKESTLADSGAGFGWLSFAYLLNGGKHATLCEIDQVRLKEAEQISEILGLRDRCTFICAPMQDLKFESDEFDIFVSVETLEHVGASNFEKCLTVMSHASKSILILTTPNRLFPLVFHDNKIPFSHWIPKNYRNHYTRFFGLNETHSNDFLFPWQLKILKKKFEPSSSTLTFNSYQEWVESYPFYSPYNYSNRLKLKAPLFLKVVYWVLYTLFGRYSFYLSPNLCRLWVRKIENKS